MDIQATMPYGESFEVTCDNCGAELKVQITRQKGHNEMEEYYCPECDKEHKKRASMPIRNVNVIKSRTDGKTDKFINNLN